MFASTSFTTLITGIRWYDFMINFFCNSWIFKAHMLLYVSQNWTLVETLYLFPSFDLYSIIFTFLYHGHAKPYKKTGLKQGHARSAKRTADHNVAWVARPSCLYLRRLRLLLCGASIPSVIVAWHFFFFPPSSYFELRFPSAININVAQHQQLTG